MDDINLRALLSKAREFEHAVGAVKFRLRIPTMAQARRIYSRYDGPSRLVEGAQDILAECVLSISGATARDVGLDSDEPLPETAEAAQTYLSDHMTVADELSMELAKRTDARQKRIEGDAKN